jgi:uncharacterized flavoprotein (TIGR03862 family)
MAAEVMALAGVRVTVFERMPSVGRKLLLAGRSGLNLTHGEPLDQMLARYGVAGERLAPALRAFGPDDLRAWSAGLGQPTFLGSSGRVFPTAFRATPLLRAWLSRLGELGVVLETRTRWIGWETGRDGAVDASRLVFEHATGARTTVTSDATVLALGGASWPRVGSDGSWVAVLREAGVEVGDLRPANCGVVANWRPDFADRYAGSPLKNISVCVDGSDADSVRGDAMITRRGLEGGPVYALSADLRDALDRHGRATLLIDLQPDRDTARLLQRLARRRPKDSLSSTLRRTVGLSPAAVAWLREVLGGALPSDSDALATLLKAVPMTIDALMPLDRAISSAGGVAFDEVDERFMLRRLPGTFVVGEMLDWEAPTGGYLLQATFSTAVAAARGAVEHLRSGVA